MTAERRRVPGKWVLLVFLCGALVLVPLATWATLRWVEAGVIETPRLNWGDRARWPDVPVQWVADAEADAGEAAAAAGAERARWLGMTERERAVVAASVELARLAERDVAGFVEPGVGSVLRQLAARAPGHFYPVYLLATWHRLRGETALAEAAYRSAFSRAHGVVRQRYVRPDGEPMAGWAAGTFVLEHADGAGADGRGAAVDASVTLVYPALEADEAGCVYLPMGEGVYRVVRRPGAAGGAVTYGDGERAWFTLADRLGALRPAVVGDEAAAR